MEQLARSTKQIGEAVRRRRKAQSLTQKELGAKTNLRQATISGLETGEPGTELQTLLTVLGALDLELVVRPRTKASMKDIEDIF